MKAKVIQAVEDAMVDAVMDSAAGLGLTPLQRAKFIVAISETLIDAVTPYVHNADAAAPPERVKRVRGPRKPKQAVVGQQPLPLPPAPTTPEAPDKVNSAPLEPAPFKGPPATAQPFGG